MNGVIRTPIFGGADLVLVSNDDFFIDVDHDDQNQVNTGGFLVRDSSGSDVWGIFETGNIFMDGTLTQGSDRNRKENIRPVKKVDILDRINDLEISTWNYIGDSTTHCGPMAQDFHEQFGYGGSDTSIGMVDIDGVALARD